MARFLVCLALVALLLSAVPVPQAQTTFSSPILNHKLWLPVWIAQTSKKGLANSWASSYLCDVQSVGATWQYSYYPAVDKCGIVESVPMIATPQMMNVIIRNDSRWIMGFNEPDLNELSPEAAAALWQTIEAIYPNKLLVSPAPSHLYPEWLAQFRAAYLVRYGQAPRLDALAAHCYMTEQQCEAYVTNTIKLADQWGIAGGVWVTEFAFDSTSDMTRFVTWLETNQRVSRYSIYTNRRWDMEWPTALFAQDGQMTKYGEAYRQ